MPAPPQPQAPPSSPTAPIPWQSATTAQAPSPQPSPSQPMGPSPQAAASSMPKASTVLVTDPEDIVLNSLLQKGEIEKIKTMKVAENVYISLYSKKTPLQSPQQAPTPAPTPPVTPSTPTPPPAKPPITTTAYQGSTPPDV